MPTLYLARDPAAETSDTRGYFYTYRDGAIRTICSTMELGWNDNKRSKSCIPAGEYPLIMRKVGKYYAAYHKRWGHPWVYEVGDVPNRSAILIHAASGAAQVQGCIATATATRITKDGRLRGTGRSREAYQKFFTIAEYERFDKLEVYVKLPGQNKNKEKTNDKTKTRRA
ncbi:MAG: DUF5675 family protein [Pseudohongiellaceae bacterium]